MNIILSIKQRLIGHLKKLSMLIFQYIPTRGITKDGK